MAKRFLPTIAVTIFGLTAMLTACGDDDTNKAVGTGGSGGGAGKGGTAGSASGGSTAGKGGSSAGTSSAGQAGDPGTGGTAGTGAAGEGGGAGAGEMGGSGGEAGATLQYACNDTTLTHKACSALVAAQCPEPTDCADCVTTRNSEREAFTSCPACVAHYDALFQCAVDAFEAGNLSAGVECVPDYGADFSLDCFEHGNEALACSSYEVEFGCPETWPM